LPDPLCTHCCQNSFCLRGLPLCRAVRTLLGIDPSPGGAPFGVADGDGDDPAAADPRSRTSGPRNLRAETSIALVEIAGAGSAAGGGGSGGGGGAAGGWAGGGSGSPDARDALQEARLAGACVWGSWLCVCCLLVAHCVYVCVCVLPCWQLSVHST
jgi:hypothetical protein